MRLLALIGVQDAVAHPERKSPINVTLSRDPRYHAAVLRFRQEVDAGVSSTLHKSMVSSTRVNF